jgi:cysteinyl-tRNA synthetase
MHIGPLLINGKKMSKSLGNFVTIRDFLKKYPAEVLRWIVLSHHYRSPINYSEELARSAEANLDAISRFFKKLTTVAGFNNENRERLGVKAIVEKTQKISDAHLNNDVNTAFKLADIFSLRSKYEEKVWNMKSSEALILKESIEKSLGTVGIPIKLPKIPSKIQKLADEREKFRASKQFSHSDGLRKEIEGLGYEIEDTPAGPFIWPK